MEPNIDEMGNENIFFSLEEKNIENTNDKYMEIEKILSEFENIDEPNLNCDDKNNFGYDYDYNNNSGLDSDLDNSCLWGYYNSELYYNEECTVKDLLKICQYYEIDKEIKSSKCKKQDIISTILYFENLSDNYYIVKKRNKMWKYINVLMNDKKMKKYLIWN